MNRLALVGCVVCALVTASINRLEAQTQRVSSGSAGATLAGPVGAADYILSVSGGTTSAYNTRTNVVDFTGTDAGAVLNSVVGNLSSGGSIYALEGTYNVTTAVFFNTGITLRCASWLANFAEQAGMASGAGIFQIGSVSGGAAITDTEISDCKITGRGADLTENVNGIKATSTSGTPTRITIRHNWINTTSDDGIKVSTPVAELLITQNTIDTCGNSNASARGAGIEIVGSTSNAKHAFIISENNIQKSWREGIRVDNGTFSAQGTITGNHLLSNVQAAAAAVGSLRITNLGTVGSIVVTGNEIYEDLGDRAIFIGAASNVVIAGNLLTGGAFDGIFLSSTAGNTLISSNAIVLHGRYAIYNAGVDTVISGNEIANGTTDGIRLDAAARTTVSGNHIRNNSGVGLNILVNTVDYFVSGNVLMNNGTNLTNASTSNGTVGCNYVGTGTSMTCGSMTIATTTIFNASGTLQNVNMNFNDLNLFLTVAGQQGWCGNCAQASAIDQTCVAGAGGSIVIRNAAGVFKCIS